MRKLSYLLLALVLALPVFPALAQDDDVVMERLVEYTENLPKGYGNIAVTDLSVEMLENSDLLIVDVREPEEYSAEEGHLPGAINIPLRELAQHLDLLPDLDQPIVVYCGSGFRSSIAMTSLQLLGYTDVRNMQGGFKAWQGEEYTVETEPVEAVADEAPTVDEDVLAAVDAQLSNLPEGWGALKAEDLNVELLENPPDVLIDVRTQKEWDEQGYIADAVHMPLESFMSFVDEWPTDEDANIVIYCAGGHRGNMAATLLRILGYTNIRNLSGGFAAWATADLAIEGAPAK